MKNTSYYIEQYFGVLLGLFTGSLTYFKGFISWGMNNILPEKSVDICFILFGFLLTVLALIVQGDNQTLKRLRSFDGYGRIIRFNRRVVILSTILGLLSLLICTILEENLPIIANHILFSIFTFLWIWLLWDFGVFIKVFYNIIIKAK